MSESKSDRRLAENEVIFRQLNEQLQDGYDHLNKIATNSDTKKVDNLALNFYCECSDETCTNHIKISRKHYDEIHKERNRFVIKKGHQVDRIERIVTEEADYLIIEKRIDPPESAEQFNRTSLDKS